MVCLNGGTCVAENGLAKCNCLANYSGTKCEVTPDENGVYHTEIKFCVIVELS